MWSYNSVPAILTAATVHVTVSPYNNVYHLCSNSWSISIANHDVAACHFTACFTLLRPISDNSSSITVIIWLATSNYCRGINHCTATERLPSAHLSSYCDTSTTAGWTANETTEGRYERLTRARPRGDRWLATATPIHWLLVSSPERSAVTEPDTRQSDRQTTNKA